MLALGKSGSSRYLAGDWSVLLFASEGFKGSSEGSSEG